MNYKKGLRNGDVHMENMTKTSWMEIKIHKVVLKETGAHNKKQMTEK